MVFGPPDVPCSEAAGEVLHFLLDEVVVLWYIVAFFCNSIVPHRWRTFRLLGRGGFAVHW